MSLDVMELDISDLLTQSQSQLTDDRSAFGNRPTITSEPESVRFVQQSRRTNDAPLITLVSPRATAVGESAAAREIRGRLSSWTNPFRQYIEELARKVIDRQRQLDRPVPTEQFDADALRMAVTALLHSAIREVYIAESASAHAPAFEGPSGTIRERLSEFRGMKDGWLNGDGIAPPEEGLEWLADALEDHYPAGWPQPYLYPTEEGYIRAEWPLSRGDARVEIDLESRRGDWFAFADGREDSDEDIDLSESEGWERLVSLLWEWVGAG